MRRTSALIAGGGPAGAAAAITLARGGVPAELVDRSPGPRDVACGGFLSWNAIRALHRLGVDPVALGAQPIDRLRLVSGDRIAEANLPYGGAGLSRRRLDNALLGAALTAGAAVNRGCGVRAVMPEFQIARFDHGEEVAYQALFLATGKHELRGAARALAGRRQPLAVGLRASLPPLVTRNEALAGFVELHLFDEGYAGLLLQEEGRTNLCVSVSRQRLSEAGSPSLLLSGIMAEAPLLAERINDLPTRWDTVAGVPYGWQASETRPALFRLGDQAGVIASIAGDGIAHALASGTGAARALLEGGPGAAPQWQGTYRRQATIPVATAEMLRRAAERPTLRTVLVRLLATFPVLGTAAALMTRVSAD